MDYEDWRRAPSVEEWEKLCRKYARLKKKLKALEAKIRAHGKRKRK